MRARNLAALFTLPVLWIAGCNAAKFRTMPPAAFMVTWDLEGERHAGQGTWVKNHIMTALHVIDEEGEPLPTVAMVNGISVNIRAEHSGTRDRLHRISKGIEIERAPLYRMEDWTIVQTDARWPGSEIPIEPGDGVVTPGERLYMVCYDVTFSRSRSGVVPRAGSTPVAISLDVPRQIVTDVPVPQGMTLALLPKGRDWSRGGWSGSFVGRYHAERGRWEFVGIAAGVSLTESPRRHLLAIVRPPERIVQEFYGQTMSVDFESHGSSSEP